MNTSHIAPLLKCIWKYSSTHPYPPPTTIELVAGHRYWLPDGLLADEWITFFTFAPSQWFDLAPPEVKSAFEEEVITSFVDRPSFERTMQIEDHVCMHLGWLPPVQSPKRSLSGGSHSLSPYDGMNHTMEYPRKSLAPQKIADDVDAEDQSDTTSPDNGYRQAKRARLGDGSTARLSTGPALIPLSTVDPHRLRLVRAAPTTLSVQPATAPAVLVPKLLSSVQPTQNPPQALSLSQPAQPIQHAPQGNTQPAPTSAPGPHSVINLPVFPLQSVPNGRTAFVQNPAVPPVLPQLLQAQGINVTGFRPGSMLRKGNESTAWSAERIRAFVEIEGNSIHQLPPDAFSTTGNEMTNFRTPESIDMRCCPFETSIEENLTVSTIRSLSRCFVDELTVSSIFRTPVRSPERRVSG
jgi:hypothetical protein